MRVHGARAQIAAAGIREAVFLGFIQERAKEHDHAAGAARGLHVHGVQVQDGRAAELEVGVVEPGAFDADAGQDLHDPVDLFDPGKAAQHRGAAVDQAGAQERHSGVFAAVDVHGAGQGAAAFDPQVRHLGFAHLDDAAVENRFEPLDHLEAEVLLALLHPGDGALACSQRGGELALGPALLAAGVAKGGGDVFGGFLSHTTKIS